MLDAIRQQRLSRLFGFGLPRPFDVVGCDASSDQPIIAGTKLARIFSIWSLELNLDAVFEVEPFVVFSRDRSAIERGFLGCLLVPTPNLRVPAKILVAQDGAAASRGWIESERTCFDLFQLHERARGRFEIMLLITQFDPLTSIKTARLITSAAHLQGVVFVSHPRSHHGTIVPRPFERGYAAHHRIRLVRPIPGGAGPVDFDAIELILQAAIDGLRRADTGIIAFGLLLDPGAKTRTVCPLFLTPSFKLRLEVLSPRVECRLLGRRF